MRAYEEGSATITDIEGMVPPWLNGQFISNGPGQFEVGDTQFKHWFDGFALLKSFGFNRGKVQISAKYLRSLQYTESNKRGELFLSEFGTSNQGVRGALRNILYGSKYDNANVNIAQAEHGKLIAMTETPNAVVFDKESLDTIAIEQYAKDFSPHIATAHPVRDFKRNTLVNVAIKIGRKARYDILETHLSTGRCSCVASYTSAIPFYMHSFAMTENHVILYQTPVVISALKALSPWRPIVEAIEDKPQLGSQIIVINRNNGEASVFPTENFYCYHSSNAYELDHEIVLDLVTTSRGDYSALSFDDIDKRKEYQSNFTRFAINMQKKDFQADALYSGQIEYPRINERASLSQDYTYSYMCNKIDGSSPFNQIVKLNVKTTAVQTWSMAGIAVGEPIFVQNEKNNDDSVLMFLLYDADNSRSGLAIISSESLETLAIVWLSCMFAPGLHGQFFHHCSIN